MKSGSVRVFFSQVGGRVPPVLVGPGVLLYGVMFLFSVVGCAFVTFASRACAQAAIKQMHHSTTMEVRLIVSLSLLSLLLLLNIILNECNAENSMSSEGPSIRKRRITFIPVFS